MTDVDFFYAKLNRLKTALGKTKDKEVAEALGIGEKVFNARKTRNSFPEKELYALAAKRPELGLDVDYVLTGVDAQTRRARERDAKGTNLARAALRGQLASPEGEPKVTEEESLRQRDALYAAAGWGACAPATGSQPQRLQALVALLPGLRAVELESVFEMVKAIVELREALEKAARGGP